MVTNKTPKELNDLGEDGWELVTHSTAVANGLLGSTGMNQYYVFKREIIVEISEENYDRKDKRS